ncbi:beta strand repeat-containing protein [Kribbella jiaozuonensis]|uniref:IPT/TIG domain-containing protein n=1 Tax=Kribbella jiaozuonensis TaxID=2575441 RepID=A0A4U3M5Y6_9ACTN|nr:IPT/TIG domain-containing protein [Kribbella jiaozuonensis]TKK82826.1 hypothetical protein FDA38_08725 [Kribbella jiaozuonensis]
MVRTGETYVVAVRCARQLIAARRRIGLVTVGALVVSALVVPVANVEAEAAEAAEARSSLTSVPTVAATLSAVPRVTAVSPAAGPLAGGTTVTVSGANLTGATAVTFGGVKGTSLVRVSATRVRAVVPKRTAAGVVDVRVVTPGGTSAVATTAKYTYAAAPKVSAVSPVAGPLTAGAVVTLTGVNLTSASAVTFGGVKSSSVVRVSATQVRASAPARSTAGLVDVRVVTPGGMSAIAAAARYTYTTAPKVTAVSPAAGPLSGGTVITVTGANLTGATAVTVGGVNGTSLVRVSATQVKVATPARASAGVTDVRVVTPGGSSPVAAKFTYTAAPAITAVSPAGGPLAGGTVTISGTNLTGATAVTFGGVAGTALTQLSASQVRVVAPARATAGVVDVRLTTSGGTSPVATAAKYTYFASPTITAVAPNTGSTAGGTMVTITGTNLAGATAVTFGGAAGTALTQISATQLRVTAPARASADVIDVRVVTAGGTSAIATSAKFTYYAAPTISAIAPNTGPTAGGTVVTITGTNLAGATAVTFGGVAGTALAQISTTQVRVTTPLRTTAGMVDVRVVTPGGTSSPAASANYTYAAPVIEHCGALIESTTWAAGTVHVLTCPVTMDPGVTLTIAAGAIVKISGGSIRLSGGVLRALGTADAPITITTFADDTVGGDTNGDGAATSPTTGGAFLTTYYGTVLLDHVDTRWVERLVEPGSCCQESPDITIRNSSFSLSEPRRSGGTNVWGSVSISRCTTGAITDNRFSRVSLSLYQCPAQVAGNSFTETENPLSVTSHDDLSQIAMSGARRNTFTGTGNRRAVRIGGTIPAGGVFQFDRGPVVIPNVYVSGQLVVPPGAVIKDGHVTVGRGGLVRAAGTADEPVAITTLDDDTVGGDTNGDGTATTPKTSGSTFLTTNAGSIRLDHVDMRWIANPIQSGCCDDSAEITIRDSSFVLTEPQRSGEYTSWGSMATGRCSSGAISGNHFTHISLSVYQCDATVVRNTFTDTASPLSISDHPDLSKVATAGADRNVFTGTGPKQAFRIGGSVLSGTTVELTAGPVLIPNLYVSGQLIVPSGTVIKGGRIISQLGGMVSLTGTSTSPVVMTTLEDDTAGGDTNGDGSATAPAASSGQDPNLATAQGSLRLDHVVTRWLANPVGNYSCCSSSPEITIRDSTFTLDEPIRSGEYTWWGSVYASRCDTGTISRNHFTHISLRVYQCQVAIDNNSFTDTEDPLSVTDHSDLTQVDMTGAGRNTFTGTGSQQAVSLGGSVNAGTSYTVDPGPVLIATIYTEGDLLLPAGTILKSSQLIAWLGGTVRLAGTATSPVVMTTIEDDTAGGDTNGDGQATTPTATSGQNPSISTYRGTLRLDHVVSRWLASPVGTRACCDSTPEITIRDSSFTLDQPIRSGEYTWWGSIYASRCDAGAITGNHFTHVSLSVYQCPVPITDNVFTDTDSPLTVTEHYDLSQVSFAGAHRNSFTGDGAQRAVQIQRSMIPDGAEFVLDGPGTHAVFLVASISASHSLARSNGSVRIPAGSVLKGFASSPMFDLGPNSNFDALGTAAKPIVFTAIDDDTVGGDSYHNGPSPISRFAGVFDTDQESNFWTAIGGAAGVDLHQVGPGTATVDHTVVRHAETAFAGCLVCSVTVHHTDFVDVVTGFEQSFYWLPVAPCGPFMGRQILTGGIGYWSPADATGNFWGGAGGPSTDVNWVEIGAAFLAQKAQYDQLKAGLPLEDLNVVEEAFGNMASGWGDQIENLDTTTYAGVTVSVQSCTIPVINVTFPIIIYPVNAADPAPAMLHPEEILETL